MVLAHTLLLLPPDPREGCDRHRPSPPPEPHWHLQRGRPAEALEALMCWPQTDGRSHTAAALLTLDTSLPTLFCFCHFTAPGRCEQVTVNSRFWYGLNNTIGFTHPAECWMFFFLKPSSWILATNGVFGFGSVCTVEPYLPEPGSLRSCSQFAQQRNDLMCILQSNIICFAFMLFMNL